MIFQHVLAILWKTSEQLYLSSSLIEKSSVDSGTINDNFFSYLYLKFFYFHEWRKLISDQWYDQYRERLKTATSSKLKIIIFTRL